MGESKRRSEAAAGIAAVLGLGATGNYPRGKLNEEDEGGLRLAVRAHDGVVMIAFGKEVSWLGLEKQDALQFAQAIIKHAESLP